MLTRRGFFGALTALAAVPRALFGRERPIQLFGSESPSAGTYSYKITYVTDAGETLVPRLVPEATSSDIYMTDGDGRYVWLGRTTPGQQHFVHDDPSA